MIKRDRCQDNPRCCQGFQARCSDWDPASGLHQGQRSDVPRKQAGHMTANCDDQHLPRLTLAQTEPSTHDSTATCTSQTRKQVHYGAFFFLFQRGLAEQSDFRRPAFWPKSVSARPASLSIRPSCKSRRIQKLTYFPVLVRNGLRRS